MRTDQKKIALITGASSGMGREFVSQIDKACNDLDEIWVTARRIEETAFADTRAAIVRLPLDLTAEGATWIIKERLESEHALIKVLVNSAGFGKTGRVEEISLSDQTDMIRLNDVALMQMCHICIPYMAKGGYIINMASVAAFLPQMRFAVYAASKAFVLSFSRALYFELRPGKVSVTAVCPGPVDTEFFGIAEKTGPTLAIKKYFMAKPQKVVAHALAAAKARKQTAVYGGPMKLMQILSKVVPTGLLLRIYDKMV